MTQTWKSLAGGILSVVAGVLSLIVTLVFATIGAGVATLLGPIDVPGLGPWLAAGLAVRLALVGVAIAGGVCAIRQRAWGLALAGAVASLLSVFPLGIPALVFIAIAKPQFR